MKKLADYFKGFAIGLANVVAGLSGGTIAVILNVYDDLIDFFSNLVTHLVKAIKNHYKLLIGIVVGLIVGALALKKLYAIAPLPVTGFFAGLVFISLFPLSKSLSYKEGCKWNIIHTILMILSCAALIALAFGTKGQASDFSFDAKNVFILLGLGIIAAIAMILPGVSGAMILMVLGYYEKVLALVSNLFKFSMDGYGKNFLLLVIFAIGALLGLILGSKLVKLLLQKCKNSMNFIIYGLIVGSIVGMFVQGISQNNELLISKGWAVGSTGDILMHVFAVVLFILGALLAGYFEYLNNKKTKKASQIVDNIEGASSNTKEEALNLENSTESKEE